MNSSISNIAFQFNEGHTKDKLETNIGFWSLRVSYCVSLVEKEWDQNQAWQLVLWSWESGIGGKTLSQRKRNEAQPLHIGFYMPLCHAGNGKVFQQTESREPAIIQTCKCLSVHRAFSFHPHQRKLWLFKENNASSSEWRARPWCCFKAARRMPSAKPKSADTSLLMASLPLQTLLSLSSMGTVQIKNGNLSLSYLEIIFGYC